MNRTSITLAALGMFVLAACSGSPSPTPPNFANPMPKVFTSGQPTEAQFAEMKAMGIQRVIQLRPATEKGTGWEEEQAAKLGIDFVRLPIAGANDLTRENVQRFADEVGKEPDVGTLVCCGSSNRVGALFALKAFWLDGSTKEAAMELGKKAGMTRLEPAVGKLVDQ